MEATRMRTKGPDEVFCWSCGEPIKREAVICVHCGVLARGDAPTSLVAHGGKSKVAAVMLAAFLSYWCWLYTVKLDYWKFLIGIVVQAAMGVFVILNFRYLTAGDLVWISVVPMVAVWIWAIVDRAVRSAAYYARYPNYRAPSRGTPP